MRKDYCIRFKSDAHTVPYKRNKNMKPEDA